MIATESDRSSTSVWHRVRIALCCGVALGLSYGILPLFSSNQNHHFLIGLARAGLGSLQDDWLTKTADPFPVFTGYVTFVHRYLTDTVHYVVYLGLFGAYAYGLIRMTDEVSSSRESARVERLAVFAVLCVTHNEAIGYLLGLGRTHLSWWQMFHWGVAEQEIFGHGAFQASSFGMLFPLAIALFLGGQPIRAAALSGAIVPIHFSYALTAAALVVAYMFATRRTPQRAWLLGVVAMIPAAIAAIDVWVRLGPTSAAASTAAAEILVRHLPQEANAASWFGPRTIVQLLLIVAALWLVRRTRLFVIVSIPFVAGLALTITQVVTRSPQLALLFPWRVSVLLVPVATALIARTAIDRAVSRMNAAQLQSLANASIAALVFSMLLGGIRTTLHFAYFYGNPRVTAVTDRFVPDRWRRDFASTLESSALPMMRFVRSSAHRSDVYVVPPELERFRLTTGAPVLADFKSHPYKDVEVLEWRQRLDRTLAVYTSGGGCAEIDYVVHTYDVSYLVTDSRTEPLSCDIASKTYNDDHFAVYRLERTQRGRVVQ